MRNFLLLLFLCGCVYNSNSGFVAKEGSQSLKNIGGNNLVGFGEGSNKNIALERAANDARLKIMQALGVKATVKSTLTLKESDAESFLQNEISVAFLADSLSYRFKIENYYLEEHKLNKNTVNYKAWVKPLYNESNYLHYWENSWENYTKIAKEQFTANANGYARTISILQEADKFSPQNLAILETGAYREAQNYRQHLQSEQNAYLSGFSPVLLSIGDTAAVFQLSQEKSQNLSWLIDGLPYVAQTDSAGIFMLPVSDVYRVSLAIAVGANQYPVCLNLPIREQIPVSIIAPKELSVFGSSLLRELTCYGYAEGSSSYLVFISAKPQFKQEKGICRALNNVSVTLTRKKPVLAKNIKYTFSLTAMGTTKKEATANLQQQFRDEEAKKIARFLHQAIINQELGG